MDEINQSEFEQLCTLGCSDDEFACMLGAEMAAIQAWCRATYNDDFECIYKRLSTKGKIALKTYQWKAAKTDPGLAAKLEEERDEIEVLAALLKPPSDGGFSRYI